MLQNNTTDDRQVREGLRRWYRCLGIATAATFLVFFVYGFQPTPGINESHYLTKAKHFWEPSWCEGDLFLESHAAHQAFYFVFCWPLKFTSLDTFAWCGRTFVWALAAFGFSWWLIELRVRFWLVPFFAVLWLMLIERGNLAGEWVVGGLEAKSLAYAIVLIGFAALANGSRKLGWCLLGLATLFHFLVGIWVLVAMFAGLLGERIANFFSGRLGDRMSITTKRARGWNKSLWVAPLFCAACTLVATLPSLLVERGVDYQSQVSAARIQVHQRLTHHLLFNGFATERVAAFAALMILMFVVTRLERVSDVPPLWRRFAGVSLLISFFGLVLSAMAETGGSRADFANGLLRLYWFRLADFAVPSYIAISLAGVLSERLKTRRINTKLVAISLGLLAVAFVLNKMDQQGDRRPFADAAALPTYDDDPTRTWETYKNWYAVCLWIQENTPANSIFVTPADQQTFKWYAQRPEVVCWKDMPQDAESLLEWWQRVQQLTLVERSYPNGIAAYSDEQILDLAKKYKVDYFLISQKNWESRPHSLLTNVVYPEQAEARTTFVVVKVPE
jgi:hypothetical protein